MIISVFGSICQITAKVISVIMPTSASVKITTSTSFHSRSFIDSTPTP